MSQRSCRIAVSTKMLGDDSARCMSSCYIYCTVARFPHYEQVVRMSLPGLRIKTCNIMGPNSIRTITALGSYNAWALEFGAAKYTCSLHCGSCFGLPSRNKTSKNSIDLWFLLVLAAFTHPVLIESYSNILPNPLKVSRSPYAVKLRLVGPHSAEARFFLRLPPLPFCPNQTILNLCTQALS